ncbi:MAG: hypothetical protein OXU45_04105 [Candidatus Melainabacteria bacterium]|nr:hypothetical protein [Candidatus Melainabacteria bacterium]
MALFRFLDMVFLFNYLDQRRQTQDLLVAAGQQVSWERVMAALEESARAKERVQPRSAEYVTDFVDKLCTDPAIVKASVQLLKDSARSMAQKSQGASPNINPGWDKITDLRQMRMNVIEGLDYFPVNNIFGMLSRLFQFNELQAVFDKCFGQGVLAKIFDYLDEFKQGLFQRLDADLGVMNYVLDETEDLNQTWASAPDDQT